MMNRVTEIDQPGIDLIVGYEKVCTEAYLDSAGIPTIAVGNTRYADGSRVKMGDTMTTAAAIALFRFSLKSREKAVDDMTRDDIKQHEFNALVSFCYNVGQGSLKTSTLLRLVNAGIYTPNTILSAFLMWDKAHINGALIESDGLKRRRKSEACMFSTGAVNFFE
jgi:lysozyme